MASGGRARSDLRVPESALQDPDRTDRTRQDRTGQDLGITVAADFASVVQRDEVRFGVQAT